MRNNLLKLLLAGAAAAALASTAHGANLVTNGSFEAGNTGFGSDYTYVLADATPPAVYAIDDDPNDVHPSWASFGDHTSGSGLMMIVNGSQVPNVRVWHQDNIAVQQNTTYFFSTWIASTFPESPAVLDFSINGVGIGSTFNASSTTGVWQQFFTSWNSGSNDFANIALRNQNTAFSGNDFALDDIMLDTRMPGIPEPATWALMIMGFGSAGAMLRRRSRAVSPA